MPGLTLAGFRVLREVASTASFSAAADRLGYTQSAVSRQIAALEAAAGTALVTRTNRGVRLTETGALLAQHAAAVLDRVGAAEQDLADRRGGGTGRVRLGAFSTAMVALVPRALGRLRADAPALAVTLREGGSAGQLRRLARGEVDVAVVGADVDGVLRERPGIDAELLLNDPLLLAVAGDHPLARVPHVSATELEHQRWVIGSADRADGLLGAWTADDWAPRVAFTVRDWNAKLGLVAHGLGVTLVPGLAAGSLADGIVAVPIADPRARRPIVVARPAHATTREPSGRVVAALRAAATDLVADAAGGSRHPGRAQRGRDTAVSRVDPDTTSPGSVFAPETTTATRSPGAGR